jgi:hypothetical protein
LQGVVPLVSCTELVNIFLLNINAVSCQAVTVTPL